MMKFKHLISQLNRCVIDKRMPLKELGPLMREYYLSNDQNELEIYEYMLRNSLKRQQDYNKLVVYVNQTFEVNLLYWGKYSISTVHDHPINGCIATVMKGCLKERKYDPYYFDALKDETGNDEVLQKFITPSKPVYMHSGDINYISGHELHEITNNSLGYTSDGNALSLHIYSPPNHYLPDNVINFNVIEGKIETKNLIEDEPIPLVFP